MKIKIILNLLLFLIGTGCLFLSGILWNKNNLDAILIGILGLLILIMIQFLSIKELGGKVTGDGIGKISRSETAPKNPKEGDLWVDTSDKH